MKQWPPSEVLCFANSILCYFLRLLKMTWNPTILTWTISSWSKQLDWRSKGKTVVEFLCIFRQFQWILSPRNEELFIDARVSSELPAQLKDHGTVAISAISIPTKLMLNLNLVKSCLVITYFTDAQWFEILHRTHALYNISKWLSKWHSCKGRIRVRFEFKMRFVGTF